MDYFKERRKSFIEIGNIYFWTATINSWIKLLEQDALKQIVVNSLKYLYEKKKIEVYAFVVMPNHIHLIWKTLEKNGKETAQGSLLKFTAHEFKKYLTTIILLCCNRSQLQHTTKSLSSGNVIRLHFN